MSRPPGVAVCAVALLALVLKAVSATNPPVSGNVVEIHPERVPKTLWARELVWLHNIAIDTISAPSAPPEFQALAAAASIHLDNSSAGAVRISALSANAVVESRRAVVARKMVVWTDVESEVWPQFRPGAVALAGDESASLQALRREALLWSYWGKVLEAGSATPPAGKPHIASAQKLPATLTTAAMSSGAASALSVINNGKEPWSGDLKVFLPTYKHEIEIPGVTVPAHDALFLPVDVSLSDPQYCKMCSGMSNSERLLYATAELTDIEYENGILSFEFYAPNAGSAMLQLEREPNGPMLAGGRPVAYDWDAETKRAKLPIPAGKGANKRVRIAITMNAPDEVCSFENVRTMVIGQKNEIQTDYTSEGLARRSRLIVPDGWKATPEVKSPTETSYSVEVPATELHGDHAELRLEANGVGMSHVRVQLLRPVSVHVAEASSVHFGTAAELVSDPPVIPVDAPGGRNISIQLRNNAPEIRTFQVEIAGPGLEFSPAKTEISIGASLEREISVRVFAAHVDAGIHEAMIHVTGPAEFSKAVRLVMIPRGQTVSYTADVLGSGNGQMIWENARIRAVFERADGGRWMEFYWKESGKSLLPPEGVALAQPVKVELEGDTLRVDGALNLPRSGKTGNVEWKAETEGTATRYRVTENSTPPH